MTNEGPRMSAQAGRPSEPDTHGLRERAAARLEDCEGPAHRTSAPRPHSVSMVTCSMPQAPAGVVELPLR